MKTVVLKFGGTSVGSIERIKKVCKIIAFYKKKKNRVLVVTSAMSGVTNELINKSKLISNNFDRAEYDALISTGEQVSCSLIAGRLKNNGYKSRSWTSWQLPILTAGPHTSARIISVSTKKLSRYIKSGGIPVITGFQGVNEDLRITTIGRSGSDATAIMIAKFIKADECIIYTDVDGVYTTDPREYKKAKKIKKIFYDEMLEMASLGSKVMQPTSVQDAKLNKIDIKVKSSFVSKSGTLITGSKKAFSDQIITGISSTKNDAKITIVGVKDRPGVAASIFKPLSNNLINVADPFFKTIRDNVWIPVVVFGVLAVLTWLLLTKTVLGRHLYALGGNEEAARLAGIKTENVKWFAYCFGAMTAALAGLFYVANESAASPTNQARGHELNAIAAAVVALD